jgi:transcriptional regulator with XRE-family HTH domain
MNPQAQLIYQDLKTRYKKASLSKSELAVELGVSISTIDKYKKDGIGLPNYKKLGNAKNAKIIFNIIDVANFLSQTIKTV